MTHGPSLDSKRRYRSEGSKRRIRKLQRGKRESRNQAEWVALAVPLSCRTSLPALKAPSLISLFSHFSLMFLFSFPSPGPRRYLSPHFPFTVCICLRPPPLSALLFPRRRLSLWSTLTCGSEFSPWRRASSPQEQQQSSAGGRRISSLISHCTFCLRLRHSRAGWKLRNRRHNVLSAVFHICLENKRTTHFAIGWNGNKSAAVSSICLTL